MKATFCGETEAENVNQYHGDLTMWGNGQANHLSVYVSQKGNQTSTKIIVGHKLVVVFGELHSDKIGTIKLCICIFYILHLYNFRSVV